MEHQLLQKVRGLLRHLEAIKVLDTLSDIKYRIIAFAMLIFVVPIIIPFCVIGYAVASYRALDESISIPELLDGKPLGIIDENLDKKQDNDK